MTRYIWIILVLPTLACAEAVPGARARVTLLEKEQVIGTIRALPPDAITLAVDSTERTIPYASIAKLEVQNGVGSRAGTYALIGGVIAAVPGAIFGHALGVDLEVNSTEQFYFTAGGAIAFGLVGAGLGALIGKGKKVERWETIR